MLWSLGGFLASAFPNLAIKIRIFLTLPVTNCEGERSFSNLARVKNHLRSTVTQDRLNSLALLSTESNVLHMLDPDFWLSNFLYWRKESFEALILKEKVIWLTNGDKQGIIYFSAFWCGCFVVTAHLYYFFFLNFLKTWSQALYILSELYTHRTEKLSPSCFHHWIPLQVSCCVDSFSEIFHIKYDANLSFVMLINVSFKQNLLINLTSFWLGVRNLPKVQCYFNGSLRADTSANF